MIIDKTKVRKILVIKLKGIGDVVLSSISLDNLKINFPKAEIDFLTEPPSKPILENNKNIARILLFMKKEKFAGIKLLFTVFSKKYDLVIDFYSNPRTALITFFSFAKYRAGFPYRGRKYAYNLFGPEERGKYHSAELHLQFLKSIGLDAPFKDINIYLDRTVIEFSDAFFKDNFSPSDFVVGLSPSGGWDSKKCPPFKFVESALKISELYTDIKFLILWGPEDYNDAVEIFNGLKNISLLAPSTSVAESAALMKKCNIIISNDSGPMHIAAALGTPILAFFGPTDPLMQGPFSTNSDWIRLEELDCIGCNLLNCPIEKKCFNDLPIIRIIDKFSILYNKIKDTNEKN